MSMMQVIPFQGDALLAQQQEDGEVLVALRPICAALGLNWSGQFLRIKRDAVLASTVCMTQTVAEDGKQRDVVCLPLKFLNGWLFGIDERRVKESVRDKVLAYKRECYEVLWQHFRPAAEGMRSYDDNASLSGSGHDDLTIISSPVSEAGSERTMRENEWWLSLVREARLVKGKSAALALWAQSPLPQLPEDTLSASSHPVDRFLAERTEKGTPADRIQASTFYAVFAEWCEDMGVQQISLTAFGHRLSALGVQSAKISTRFYCGVKLRGDE